MLEVVITGTLIDIIQFLVTGGAVWGALRFLDKSSGNKFKDAYNKIKEDSFALAAYHGLRIIAAAVLFGAIVG